jgi:hypothetical protein
MKQLKQFKRLLNGFAVSAVLAAAPVVSVAAAPLSTQPPAGKSAVAGPQAKPAVEPGKNDAKGTDKLGPTASASQNVTALSGNVSSVDFSSFYNYCYKDLVYTTVHNTTASTQYIHVQLYNQGSSRDLYTSVAANSYAYPAFYGVVGSYTAYLYVWNGSSYVYDEYMSGTNTCNVSVSRVYNAGGWVELKIQNLGTAYATQVSSELAPYPGSGTYTGTQYDYPTAGGAAIYRWFQVGTLPYGITSYTSGSSNSPYFFTGDL